MSDTLSRRDALKSLALAAGAVSLPAVLGRRALADGQTAHVPTTDPVAVGLGYTEDATKVDAKKYSKYKAGQKCATCNFGKGKAGDAWIPCQLFALRQVNANGWCNSWIQKTG